MTHTKTLCYNLFFSGAGRNVTRLRPNQTLLLALITTFLAMQWSTSHIHLGTAHDHNNNHHQHFNETHSHLLAGHHSDSIDSSHQSDDLNTVALDQQYFSASTKKKTASTVISTTSVQQADLFQRINVTLPVLLNTRLDHLSRSIVSPRAPPRFS